LVTESCCAWEEGEDSDNRNFSEMVEISFIFMLITVSLDVKGIKLTGLFALLKAFEQV